MSSLSDTTNDIHITNPEMWTLSLGVSNAGLRLFMYNDKEINSMVSRNITIGKNISSDDDYLKAIEDAVYDNPLLLGNFKKVSILVESSHFLFFPPEYGDDEAIERVFAKTFPECCGDVVTSRATACGADVAFMLRKGLYRFLLRTFDNPPVRLNLEVLSSHFVGKNNYSTVNKEYVYVHDNRLDLCVFKRGRLQLANTFTFRHFNDAIFFILGIWNMFSMDPISDEIQIAGDKEVKDAIVPVLREYVTYVLPVVMPPSAMKLGNDVVKAPLDLILLSLCG